MVRSIPARSVLALLLAACTLAPACDAKAPTGTGPEQQAAPPREEKAPRDLALETMDQLYQAAVTYYNQSGHSPDGTSRPCSFPPSQPLTPSLPGCCRDKAAKVPGYCQPDPRPWQTETWRALNFSPTIPLPFSYQFTTNNKTGAEAEFTIRVHGDLDCNGRWSTFERHGRGGLDQQGQCRALANQALFVEDPAE